MKKNYRKLIQEDIMLQVLECDSPTIYASFETIQTIFPDLKFNDDDWLKSNFGKLGTYKSIPVYSGKYDYLEVEITDF